VGYEARKLAPLRNFVAALHRDTLQCRSL